MKENNTEDGFGENKNYKCKYKQSIKEHNRRNNTSLYPKSLFRNLTVFETYTLK